MPSLGSGFRPCARIHNPIVMSHSQTNSTSNSVESSPIAVPRCIPSRILKQLPLSQQIIPKMSDSESDQESLSDASSIPKPAPTHYVSPSKPEKRRHLSVPSPKMQKLSIVGLPSKSRYDCSIPGLGEGIRILIRVSGPSFLTARSAQVTPRVRRVGQRRPINLSESRVPHVQDGSEYRRDFGLQSPQSALLGVAAGKCVQRLFKTFAQGGEGEQSSQVMGERDTSAQLTNGALPDVSLGSPIGFPVTRRGLLVVSMSCIESSEALFFHGMSLVSLAVITRCPTRREMKIESLLRLHQNT